MPIFAIYKYKLTVLEGRKDIFEDAEVKARAKRAPYKTPEECFGSFFVAKSNVKMTVVKSSGNGDNMTSELESYDNEILALWNNVILMTIENNKVKHTINHKQDITHEHHPFCHIVIDNRPGRQFIAIEKSSAFDSNPDKVKTIFQRAFCINLSSYGIGLELHKEHKDKNQFWTVVNDVRSKFKDVVKQVRLDFSSEDELREPNPSDIITVVSALAKKSESQAAVTLNAEGEGEVKLDDLYDDLTNMANICMTQKGYDLTVKFRKFGVYKYGMDIMAQFGVEDGAIEKFEIGEKDFNYEGVDGNFALTVWLDRIYELLKDYNDEEPIQQKRNKGHRR